MRWQVLVNPAVEGREVAVSSGRRRILRGCSFVFERGSFTGILGPNGAGKTTLLGLCNGMVKASSGTVLSLGEQVTARAARELRKRIGYVAQWREIDPRQPITVYESVLSGTYGRVGLFRRPGGREQRLAGECLEAVAAGHLADRPLGHLSGGEAQRVAIARALAQEPELLLLDEPTASLDWQARRDVLRLVAGLRQSSSLTIAMVTHELNALPDLCDRVIFVKAGRVVWQGSTPDALDAARLSDLYGTPVDVLEHGGKPVILM